MKSGLKSSLFMIALIQLMSCDTTLIYELPENPPRIVMNFVGENDRLWRGNVSLSRGILDYRLGDPVPDARVTLYENGQLLETLQAIEGRGPDHNFEAKFSSPRPGYEYRMEVISDQYGTAMASYIQPEPIFPESLEVEVLGPNLEFQMSTDVQFKVGFTDPQGEDYYEILISASEDSTEFLNAARFMVSFVDPSFPDNDNYFYTLGLQLTDRNFNGAKASIVLKAVRLDYPLWPNLRYYRFHLRHVTKEYYNFVMSYMLQKNTSGDPYAQPVMVETNVQNGLGIFCGFTETYKTFKIEK